MIRWSERTLEERLLLNPAFCTILLWAFTSSGNPHERRFISFAESFLLLPIVLHHTTREALPRQTRTSLAVWLDDNPAFQATIAKRARDLRSYTRDAILFASSQEFIELSGNTLKANVSKKRSVNSIISRCSTETNDCISKAKFLGKWFVESGDENTVLALMGVKP